MITITIEKHDEKIDFKNISDTVNTMIGIGITEARATKDDATIVFSKKIVAKNIPSAPVAIPQHNAPVQQGSRLAKLSQETARENAELAKKEQEALAKGQ